MTDVRNPPETRMSQMLPRDTTGTATITYDRDIDNCAGGCARKDNRRVLFGWYGPNFACPGCFECVFGPLNGDEPIITLTPEQVEAGRQE